jgi:3-deoxy-manno-octulosonate cytidylyltransferase (CMP-KDO synthetase)
MSRTLVIIPARMQSTRLPDKPLADIGGKPMIVHVWERAAAAAVGQVVVATDSDKVCTAVRTAGGEAVMTRTDHVSGSDRVCEAARIVDPEGAFEFILNLQGDLPLLGSGLPRQCLEPLLDPGPDIATIAAEITNPVDRTNPNAVKVVGAATSTSRRLRALYFTRATAPFGDGPLYHHFGMYAFRRAALERFVSLPPSPLEKREQLEQLRALEDGMRIDVTIVDSVPSEVNTPEDLELVRGLVSAKPRA